MTKEARKEGSRSNASEARPNRSAVENPVRSPKRLGKMSRMKALLASGVPADVVASIVGVKGTSVRNYANDKNKTVKNVKENNSLGKYIDEIKDKNYKSTMGYTQEITNLLAGWDETHISELINDLRSGKLLEKYKSNHNSTEIENSFESKTLSTTINVEKTAIHLRDHTHPPGGEIYTARVDRKETAPEFIERVYGASGWLTGEFTRADLRNIDPSAIIGLKNWERVHGRSTLNLPTIKERNDQLLARDARADPKMRAAVREANRLRSAQQRRRSSKNP